MSATLIVRHPVADYAAWRAVYDSVGGLRAQHGCTADHVLRDPANPGDVAAIHVFGTLDQAQAFTSSEELKAAMMQGGVTAPPRIEIYENV